MDLIGNVSGSISLGGGGAGGIEDMFVKKTTEYESIVENNKAYLDLTWVASKADLSDYVTLEDMADYYDKIEVNGLLNNKQDKLTAGDNITINNNVISASGGGVVYSTDEIVIGTWFEKTLYRKCFENVNVTLGSSWTNIINVSDLNISELIITLPIGIFDGGSISNLIDINALQIRIDSGYIQGYHLTNYTTIINNIAIDYIKNTD